jgi:TetR/AcrR family transcriptional repressor of bet genes
MPKIVDRDTERKSIAEAAIGVIGTIGLDAARLRDVAAAAGATTGAVTHYFDGKDAVLEAALAEMAARLSAALDEPLPKGAAPRELAGYAASFLPLDEEGRLGWRVWIAFWGRAIVNDRLRRQHREVYARFVARLSALTGARGARARDLADAIIAAIDGVGIRATLEPESWPPARQRRVIAALLEPMLSAAQP